jgi:ABC-type multidrug transport system fused ATPase/permease subunit
MARFSIPMIPLGYGYYLVQKWFRKTSTELQRITSILKNPIRRGAALLYAVQGFLRHHECDVLAHAAHWERLSAAWPWRRTGPGLFQRAGWTGPLLQQRSHQYLNHGVRMIATIEAQMNSVERILYYSYHVDMELDEFTDRDPAPGKWPNQGAIEVKNASLRYRDGPLVLKDLSLQIKPGEKFGVCGRTGSGKSSLMVALFRISEIEKDGGMVFD